MEPVLEDSESPDPDTWSGSNTPADLYCSQDEAYLGETESDTDPQEASQLPHTQQVDPGRDPLNPVATLEHQSSLSDYTLEKPPSDGGLSDHEDPSSDTLSPARASSYHLDSGDSDTEHLRGTPTSSRGSISDHDASGRAEDDPSHHSSSPGQVVTPPRPRKHSGQERRQSLGSVDSTEEGGGGGGRVLAPPVSVSFGIPAEGAEPTEEWGAASETDLCRPSRHRARHARQRRSESQSEKEQKEAKSKCKHIALLLTAAPNPKSKGVLMFKKSRQRAKKYTLVSYGTGEIELESEEDEDGYDDDKQGQAVRFSLSAASDSEFEEEYCLNAQGQNAALNFNLDWDARQVRIPTTFNWEEMEHLPETKGKGVQMFAQRRQRMDEIAAEHEEMRSKGLPVEGFIEPQNVEIEKAYPLEEDYPDQTYMDLNAKQQLLYQDHQQQQQIYQQQEFQHSANGMNGLEHLQYTSMPKALVPNRTAKPFLGSQNRMSAPFSPIRGVPSSSLRKPDNIFKVPVPVHTTPQVWSPTGDIIASRDERIAVPAIKSGILPDPKRRGTNKGSSNEALNPQLQNRGDRRSFIESCPEEDYLSLGAEACNFMQPPRVKHKNPPPVAPKPTINPACPPWATDCTTQVPLHAPRSPIPASAPGPAVAPALVYSAPPQNWAPSQPQPAVNVWAQSPTQAQPQPPMSAWAAKPSAQHQLSWTQEPQPAPVSIQTPTPTHVAPPQQKIPWTKSQHVGNSVASCPPQHRSPYLHASKAPPASPMGHASDTGACQSADGPNLKGRGAALFARRQSRMEKFVVDAETVQANKAKSPSPTPSLPSTWRYSPNVRAPPPVSYNPILAPFYPPAALKQPPSTSPKPKPKASKQKPKPPPKHLNALDVMKHQPYQLDSSLFTYNTGVKGTSPKTSPLPPPESNHAPVHSPSPVQTPSPAYGPSPGQAYSPALTPSPLPASGTAPSNQPIKPVSPAKASGPVSVPYPFVHPIEPALIPQQLDRNLPVPLAVHDGPNRQALFSPCPPRTSKPCQPAVNTFALPISATHLDSELISRCALPMAPRPKFSAKKLAVGNKQWKHVVMQH